MGDLIKGESGGLIGLLYRNGGDVTILKLLVRHIFLFDMHVTGISHVEGTKRLFTRLTFSLKLIQPQLPITPTLNSP